ncbi:MAG: PIN domain-containing protein [Gammaproteobacteria bacterium]|nr:PIN domain-containing protein [Gammaproteobacteria bacterium]MDE0273234.1 PIN domain-containing protein [Gammaproteobacteria bacterium]
MTHWLLVDYENIQPSFRAERLSDTRIVFFHGAQQGDAPAKLKSQLSSIDAEFVRCTKTGKNALDFHLTYYLGRLAAQHPNDDFHVLSKDKGYDPLIEHLKNKGADVRRLEHAPSFKSKAQPNPPHRKTSAPNGAAATKQAAGQLPPVATVRKALQSEPNRPRSTARLRNWINHRFNKNLSDAAFAALLNNLTRGNVIVLRGDNVQYEPQGTAARA